MQRNETEERGNLGMRSASRLGSFPAIKIPINRRQRVETPDKGYPGRAKRKGGQRAGKDREGTAQGESG